MFSQKNGFASKETQKGLMEKKLRDRLWTVFYKYAYYPYDLLKPRMTDIENMLCEIGGEYTIELYEANRKKNSTKLHELYQNLFWYEVYDFLESYLIHYISEDKKRSFTDDINRVLSEEKSAYRIIGNEIASITNAEEIVEIEKAMLSPLETVDIHLRKSLELYSDRTKPDYENSIKESISAVEAICCIITGAHGSDATLGKTLKKLRENGIDIHPSLGTAFEKMYGFTSDQSGIRHGGIDFIKASEEDARYMLVTCSAFINYLISKREKMGKQENG